MLHSITYTNRHQHIFWVHKGYRNGKRNSSRKRKPLKAVRVSCSQTNSLSSNYEHFEVQQWYPHNIDRRAFACSTPSRNLEKGTEPTLSKDHWRTHLSLPLARSQIHCSWWSSRQMIALWNQSKENQENILKCHKHLDQIMIHYSE